ncbi:MAG: hypothetical protein K0R43_903 [Pseudoduganella sp.]|jgi:hypothetical protein|nr:hypothetical protein [Pseudoduganella sp.]
MLQIDELTAPPSPLCAAVQDVMGVQFDPTNAADLTMAAGLARKLSADPEKSALLAASLARHIKTETKLLAPTLEKLKTVRWQTAAAPANAVAELDEDLPTLALEVTGTASPQPARSKFASEPEVDVIVQLQPLSPGLHTPDQLGFDFTEPMVRWDTTSPIKWQAFMALAEGQLPLHGSLAGKVKTLWNRKPLAFTEQAARNHCVVNLHATGTDSAAHFLFEGDDVYLLVVHIGDRHLPSKAKANIADVDAFSRTVVSAFDGNLDDAHAALTSLRHALS